jgi:hypothetical protein
MSSFLCGVVITLMACALLAPRCLAYLGRLLAEPEGSAGKLHIVRSVFIGVGLAALIVILFTLFNLWLVPPIIHTIESAK